MSRVFIRMAARGDLAGHFAYLTENASPDTAERFLLCAQAAFERLAAQPLMGAPLALRHPDLAGMRKWRVQDFNSHLIFYQPRADGVSIVRVLNAAQDWWSLLGIET